MLCTAPRHSTRQALGLALLALLAFAGSAHAAGPIWLRLEDLRVPARPGDPVVPPQPPSQAAPQADAVQRDGDAGTDAPAVRWEHRAAVTGAVYSGDRSLSQATGIGVATASSIGKGRTAAGQLAWNVTAVWRSPRDNPPAREVLVRELSWQTPLADNVDLRFGRLMPAWGRADGINPTDNLSPRDDTLLSPEMDDTRFGREGVQLDLTLPGGTDTLSGWVFPRDSRNRIPLPPAPGLAYRIDGPAGRQGLWAVKWDHAGQGLDASLSYLDGTNLMPDLRIHGPAADGGLVVALSHARQRVLGADVSFQDGPRVWRGEAAWTRPSHTDGVAPAKKPAVWLVGGPEWTQAAWTVGVQGVLQQVSDWQGTGNLPVGASREIAAWQASVSNQTAPRQRGLTLRVAHRAWNDTLRSDIGVLALWSQGGSTSQPQGMVRGKVEYALSDVWSIKAGLEASFGPRYTFFGLWRDNRLVYLQMRRHL